MKVLPNALFSSSLMYKNQIKPYAKFFWQGYLLLQRVSSFVQKS